MTYNKPSNVQYTEMAIFIDEHMYSDDSQDALCFEYMYHLFNMFAAKGAYFNTWKDYDNFSLFAASRLFIRYRNSDDDKLPKIKSCLNYIKKTVYPLKVDYQRASFDQIFDESVQPDTADSINYYLRDTASNQSRHLLKVDFEQYLRTISRTVKNYLKQSPYRKDKVVMHDIYVSCMLSILNAITISKYNYNRLKNKIDKKLPIDDLMDKIYKEERMNCVVVYGEDKGLKNYISTLVNGLFKEIARDLKYMIGSYEFSDDTISDIISSQNNDGCGVLNNVND